MATSNDYSSFVHPSPSLFLPHLKSFTSEICLMRTTLWLKEKPEMSHVVINCFHLYDKNEVILFLFLQYHRQYFNYR